MRLHLMTPLIAFLLLVPVARGSAQTAADPSGHWEGAIAIPGSDIAFAVDIARNSDGALIVTVSGTDVTNLPLTRISMTGTSLSFQNRSDQPFGAELAADGKTMYGDTVLSGFSLPFRMTRTGDAKIPPPPTSPPIAEKLEGTWEGVLNAPDRQLRFVLTMLNRPDGRAMASIVSLDEGGLTVPVVVTRQGTDVHIEQRGVAGSYSLTVNAAGTELTGTFTQGADKLAVTIRR